MPKNEGRRNNRRRGKRIDGGLERYLYIAFQIHTVLLSWHNLYGAVQVVKLIENEAAELDAKRNILFNPLPETLRMPSRPPNHDAHFLLSS
jgi:hypothetical protein